MRCALFGKLPSKRDFVSLGMERPFLDLWENWLQAGVAMSREHMGAAWQEAFLSAPIWRFWLGARIAGTATTGALMPSVDKVGRYFPLSLCAAAPPGSRIEPPPDPGLEAWLEPAEQFLLHMLDDELEADLADLLGTVTAPALTTDQTVEPPIASGAVVVAAGGDLGPLFQCLAAENHALLHAGRSYWWTHGGTNHPPQLLVAQGMPGPSLFAVMLGVQQDMAQQQ